MKLYTYWRSSSAYRVRIALNLKGLDYESIPVHLAREGGEQRKPEYLEVNPAGLVPAFVHDKQILIESPAIIEYLDEVFPEPRLLPDEPVARAVVRAMASLVACEIQPLNNSGVTQFLHEELGQGKDEIQRWYEQWIRRGFGALEQLIQRHGDGFSFGATLTLADVYLVPQVYNALRFDCDLSAYPGIRAVRDACSGIDAFVQAAPELQPDAE